MLNCYSQLASHSIIIILIIIIRSIELPLQSSLLPQHLVLKLTAFTNSPSSQHYHLVLSGPA